MMFLLIEKSWHHGPNKTDKGKSCRKKRLNSDAFEQQTWNGLLFIHNSNWRQTVNMAISWLLLGIHYYLLRLIAWLALAQALACWRDICCIYAFNCTPKKCNLILLSYIVLWTPIFKKHFRTFLWCFRFVIHLQ